MARKRSSKKRGGKKGFASKAQWRWAFATKKSWARKHAHQTRGGYRRLPRKRGR
ncbi:hypothetical protein SEA_JAMZY_4 [Gordonia phage Jamzy]|nr:hypothetical protein SEA_JAMZY_4 [Gordonia phage Jamzy]